MMEDPLFPNRPVHPDFVALSRLAIELDNDPRSIEEITDPVIDLESITYMAVNRGAIAKARLVETGEFPDMEDAIAAGWMDGAIVGILWERARHAQD